jgi:hypothetical protein
MQHHAIKNIKKDNSVLSKEQSQHCKTYCRDKIVVVTDALLEGFDDINKKPGYGCNKCIL